MRLGVKVTQIYIFALFALCSCNVNLRIFAEQLERDITRLGEENSNRTGCDCKRYHCGCCVHAEFDKINLNDTVCVNASYLPEEYGVELAIILDGKTLVTEKISAKNPPPLCVAVPHLKKEASICIRFTNLSWAPEKFSGCIYLEARLYHVIKEDVLIGCFKIPPGSSRSKVIPLKSHHAFYEGSKLDKATERLISALMSKQYQNGELVNVIGLE